METQLLEKIAEILEVDQVSKNDELRSFDAWDSLTALSIIALVHADCAKTLSNAQLKEMVTINDLVTFALD